MIRKALLGLSLMFTQLATPATFSVPVHSPAVHTTVHTSSAAAASAAASAARHRREQAAENKMRQLLANPNTEMGALRKAAADGDYAVARFDKRDLTYVAQARKDLFGPEKKYLNKAQVSLLMAKSHTLCLQDVGNNTRALLADPSSTAAEIKTALRGYDLRLYKGTESSVSADHLEYLDEARKEVAGNSTQKLSSKDVVKMVDLMQKKKDDHNLNMGLAVGGSVVLLLGGAAYGLSRFDPYA